MTDPEVPQGMISGRVLTTDNQPAASVTIQIKGTNRITTSDANGFFYFRNIREGSYVLEVSMVGLKPQEVQVDVKKDHPGNVIISLSEDSKELSRVVIRTQKTLNNRPVSIGKIEINPMELPQSFTVIGQGLIRDQQALRLSDVIRNVNGVYLATTRASTQENFSARGYSLSSGNLFKNGSRINSGAMPEMSSLEKVEVLKGSAAILFGNVAPGGIINMVTKQPRFDLGG